MFIDASQYPDTVAGTHEDVLLLGMSGCFCCYHKKSILYSFDVNMDYVYLQYDAQHAAYCFIRFIGRPFVFLLF